MPLALLVELVPPKTFDVADGSTGFIVVVLSPKTKVLFISAVGFETLLPIDEVLPKTKPPAGLLASGFMVLELEPKLNVVDCC